MKILVYGAGVIGTTYGWQLAQAGQEISLLVRPGKKAAVQDGIRIHCRDERSKPVGQIDTLFCPRVVDALSSKDVYDLLGVPMPVLTGLAPYFERAHA